MTNRHADLKRQYCEIWIDDPEPWKRVEIQVAVSGKWEGGLNTHPEFNDYTNYRIVPEQITIAGITFDAPLREEPEKGQAVWHIEAGVPSDTGRAEWCGSLFQLRKLKAGGYFATAEAAAACARAYALLVGGEV